MLQLQEILNKKRIHFVGIGGVSMSALAGFLSAKGICISGSDLAGNELTEQLAGQNVTIFTGHNENYASGCDCLVYTSAVSDDNPELLYALKNNIPVLKRSELLGIIFNSFKEKISVCGMHGKTTTTALIAHILSSCGKSPTAFIGGVPSAQGSNLCLGKSGICVAEACEYRRSFLNLFPTVNCFLNVDKDHLDYYRDLNDIKDAFREFALNTSDGGIKIVNGDDDELASWEGIKTFGLKSGNDFYADGLKHRQGFFSFAVIHNGILLTELNLKIPGKHNIYNALCAFCAAYYLGCDVDGIKTAIETFAGVQRRFRLEKGRYCDFVIDYAHHPQEIECLLSTVKLFDYEKIFLVFQPHTYTRTKALFDEFAAALKKADEVVLISTYAAREPLIEEFDAENLADLFRQSGVNVSFLKDVKKLPAFAKKNCRSKDILLITGAGDIFAAGETLKSGEGIKAK